MSIENGFDKKNILQSTNAGHRSRWRKHCKVNMIINKLILYNHALKGMCFPVKMYNTAYGETRVCLKRDL